MGRLIKRYDNRKLYDTVAKQYVSLHEIAVLIRAGDEVVVTDNATGEDLTAQTLGKVILEEGSLPPRILHELVRSGEKLVAQGAGKLQQGVDKLVRASLERVAHVREVRNEVARMRERVKALEKQIENLEEQNGFNTDGSVR